MAVIEVTNIWNCPMEFNDNLTKPNDKFHHHHRAIMEYQHHNHCTRLLPKLEQCRCDELIADMLTSWWWWTGSELGTLELQIWCKSELGTGNETHTWRCWQTGYQRVKVNFKSVEFQNWVTSSSSFKVCRSILRSTLVKGDEWCETKWEGRLVARANNQACLWEALTKLWEALKNLWEALKKFWEALKK